MSSIELSGFEELETLLQEMTLTDTVKKKAMKSAVEVIAEEVRSNTPSETGSMKKQIKTKVNKNDFSVTGQVIMGAWYTGFEEFGTSQNKKNIGFFERSVNNSENEAIEVLTKELLK
jgi:HK97 gp10 family phage protein